MRHVIELYSVYYIVNNYLISTLTFFFMVPFGFWEMEGGEERDMKSGIYFIPFLDMGFGKKLGFWKGNMSFLSHQFISNGRGGL
jgi:hypothetical protein